ncbi:acyl-CoA dehydrogenase family protein, partial [Escherichia coli]
KTFITGAKEYPYMLVLARDPQPKDPKKAFTLWWVDSSKPGIKINPLHKIGWHMLSTCEVYLDNVEVEESDMVGEEGMGFLNVMYNFEMERLINAARSTGFAECAFEDAARYANQRIAFGKPIGHNQMIQEKLALMAIKIDNMRNMVLKVAWQADQHQSLRTSAALAKLYCARTAMEVIDDAIQIMGGLGYTDEARVSRFWRDVRCERIGGGTDEIMIYVAGRQILKDYQNK